jgi:beta-lactamase regulating signal transducer with metallopeptidase domain
VTSASLLPGAAAALDLALRATIVIGIAWAAAAFLKKAGASAAARHLAWLFGIAALLGLPVLAWLLPDLRLAILPSAAMAPGPAWSGAQLSAPPPEGPLEAWGWSGVWLLAYGMVAGALLLRIGLGRQLLARLWREADPTRDRAWGQLLCGLSNELGLARPVQLRIARGPAMPMTWGTLAPKVLLPAEAAAWPDDRKRMVLLHELAHVARRDSLSRSLAALACALYWFHPGAWLAAARMRTEQEHAADDRVLAAGEPARAYALSLLHLARRVDSGLPPHLAATMASACQLERRLVSITAQACRGRPGPAFLCSSALLAASATLVAAAGVPVSAASTHPASFQAGRTVVASTPRPDPAETSFPAVEAEALARPAGDDAFAGAGPGGRASAAGAGAPEGQPGTAAGERTRATEAQPEAPPLPAFGWELRPRDAKVEIDPPGGAAQSPRLASPARRSAASNERGGRPKWARLVPRLLLPGMAKGAGPVASQSTATLSLEMDVGAP